MKHFFLGGAGEVAVKALKLKRRAVSLRAARCAAKTAATALLFFLHKTKICRRGARKKECEQKACKKDCV